MRVCANKPADSRLHVDREGRDTLVHDIVVFRLHRTIGPFPEVERKLCLPA